MYLSPLQQIFRNVLRFSFALTVDARSYFYQFPIHPFVRNFFGLAFSRRRGTPSYRRLTRLCMGWRHSPCIAQRTSRTLLKELRRRHPHLDFFTDVWLDNFVFAANTVEELKTIEAQFFEICDEINLQLHEPSEVSSSVKLLGFVLNMSDKTICHTQKWLEHLSVAATQLVTFRDWAKLCGNIIWGYTARESPLAFLPHTIDY